MTVGCNAMELARRCETINLLKFNHERPVYESARFANSSWKQRLAARSPSSENTTDFCFPTGSLIRPFSCSRFNASQSMPFHARHFSCSVR
jgi:hypothetical protein